MNLKRLAIGLLVAVAAVTAAMNAAVAQPQIVQLGCDTLSFIPPRVHVPFSVINLSSVPICSVHLIPIPSGPFEPCEIFECSHPPGWFCVTDSLGGAHWRKDPAVPPPGCIGPFQKLDGFDIIIDPPYCCYRVQFDDSSGHIFHVGIACFNCESPVPNKMGTWGQVKLRYR